MIITVNLTTCTLFSPLGKLAGRTIYFTLRNFFLFLIFMISRRQIISGSAGRIFAVFTSDESFLDVDDRSGPLFFDMSRDVAMATDFVQKWGKITYPLHLSLCQSKREWDIAISMGALTAPVGMPHWDSQRAAIQAENYARFRLVWSISPDILYGFSQSFHHMKAL